MGDWKQEYLGTIEECEDHDSKLTTWEREFLDSLSTHLAEGREPTLKQVDKLDQIWTRVTRGG